MKRAFLILLIALGAPAVGMAREGAPPPVTPLQGLIREPVLDVGPVLGLLRDPIVWEALGALEGTRIDEWDEQAASAADPILPWLRRQLGRSHVEMLGDAALYFPGSEDRTPDLRRLALDVAQRIEVDIEVRAPSGEITSGQVHVPLGGRAHLGHTRSRHLLSHYDVELACDNSGGERPSAIGNPGVASVVGGIVADVRAYDLEPDGRLAIEAIVQVASIESRTEHTRAKYLGTVDFPTSRGMLAVLSAVVRPGMPIESVLRCRGDAYRIRLAARRVGPKPRKEQRGTLRRYDVGFHVLPPWRASLWEEWGDETRTLRPFITFGTPAATQDVIAGLLSSRAPQAAYVFDAHGGLFVDARPVEQSAIQDALRQLAGSSAACVQVELTLRTSGKTIAHCRMPAVDGRPCLARIGIDDAVLLDADVEVG